MRQSTVEEYARRACYDRESELTAVLDDNYGPGTITNVSTGSGLEGGGSGPAVTIQVAGNAITAAHLAVNSVGASEIATSAVGAAEIATNAVGAAEIAASAVGASEIAANAVGISELNGAAIFEPIVQSFESGNFDLTAAWGSGQTVRTAAVRAPTNGTVLAIATVDFYCLSCSASNLNAYAVFGLSNSSTRAASQTAYSGLGLHYDTNSTQYNTTVMESFNVSTNQTLTVYLRGSVAASGDTVRVLRSNIALVFMPE